MKKYKERRIICSNFSTSFNCDGDERDLRPNTPKMCYNLKTKTGNLIVGNGFQKLVLPKNQTTTLQTRIMKYEEGFKAKKMWRYSYYSEYNLRQEYMLVVLTVDLKLYFINLFSTYNYPVKTRNTPFNKEPTAITYRIGKKEYIAFASPKDNLYVWYCDDNPYEVTTAPKFLSLCYHNNRIFAIDSESNHLVRYSSTRNPLDWTIDANLTVTGGGVIEINDYKGGLQNLVSFLDNVFVFRDFGVSKISTYAGNTYFSATNIFNSGCKVYGNTACVCGKYVYFLCEDGLYKLTGYSVQKIPVKFTDMFSSINQKNINTCFFENKLYIACNLNFGDDKKIGTENGSTITNNALIEFDTDTDEYNITRGVDISCMVAIKDLNLSKLIICMNGDYGTQMWQLSNDGKLETTILDKKWQSGKVHFNLFDKEKILKEINLIATKDCHIIVTSENGMRDVLVKGQEEMQRVRINLKGKNFNFSFESNFEDIFISSPQFLFNVEEY